MWIVNENTCSLVREYNEDAMGFTLWGPYTHSGTKKWPHKDQKALSVLSHVIFLICILNLEGMH